MKWETTAVLIRKDDGPDSILGRMGMEGWEPWAIKTWHGVFGGTYIYFKRPVPAPATP